MHIHNPIDLTFCSEHLRVDYEIKTQYSILPKITQNRNCNLHCTIDIPYLLSLNWPT